MIAILADDNPTWLPALEKDPLRIRVKETPTLTVEPTLLSSVFGSEWYERRIKPAVIKTNPCVCHAILKHRGHENARALWEELIKQGEMTLKC